MRHQQRRRLSGCLCPGRRGGGLRVPGPSHQSPEMRLELFPLGEWGNPSSKRLGSHAGPNTRCYRSADRRALRLTAPLTAPGTPCAASLPHFTGNAGIQVGLAQSQGSLIPRATKSLTGRSKLEGNRQIRSQGMGRAGTPVACGSLIAKRCPVALGIKEQKALGVGLP